MRRDGKPISHHIFSGNTGDVKAFKAVILDLKERLKEMEPDISPYQVIKDLLTVRPACRRQGGKA